MLTLYPTSNFRLHASVCWFNCVCCGRSVVWCGLYAKLLVVSSLQINLYELRYCFMPSVVATSNLLSVQAGNGSD